jgi:cytochrome bd-type quinol oxidase subunit 1
MSLDADTAPALQPTAYKLEPSRFAEYRRGMFIRLGIVIPVVTAGLLYLMWRFDKERDAFRLIFIPALVAWIVYRQFKDQRRNWQTLVFEFRDGKFIRRLDKYPTVELVPGEVTAILESPRGITIETNERVKRLFLSNKLSDYEGLRSRLLSWAPTVKVTSWRRSYWDYVRDFSEVLACLCVFGGPLYLMFTSFRAVILPLGLILSLAMLGMILHVRNSPDIPTRTKKLLWILLLLPILPMLLRLFFE